MGVYIRKSVSFGPVRINLSKSGIGASVGVKGARVSVGPKGTYLHMGRYGVYYSQRLDGTSQYPASAADSTPSVEASGTDQFDPEDLIAFSPSAIADEINARSRAAATWGWYAGGVAFLVLIIASIALSTLAVQTNPDTVLLSFGIWSILGLSVSVGGGMLAYRAHVKDELRRTTPVFFHMTPAEEFRFKRTSDAVRHLSNADRVWLVGTCTYTSDWKRNAGCGTMVARHPVRIASCDPPHIATNVSIECIDLGLTKLFFFPSELFVLCQGNYSTVPYSMVDCSFGTTTFVENQGVTPDSQVKGSTWRYVRKDGGPDLRFANNVQIPIVAYGQLALRIGSSVVNLMVSNIPAAEWFSRCIRFTESPKPRPEQPQGGKQAPNAGRDNTQRPQLSARERELRRCGEILGVGGTVTTADLTRAYRQKAQECHPDKVAGLSPEFQKLAEQKMKELNHAYGVLKEELRLSGESPDEPFTGPSRLVAGICPHCQGRIQFDANEFGDRDSVNVPCPHCGVEVRIAKP